MHLFGAVLLNVGSSVHQYPGSVHAKFSIFFPSDYRHERECFLCLFFLEEEWHDIICSSVRRIVDKSLPSCSISLGACCTSMKEVNLLDIVQGSLFETSILFFSCYMALQLCSQLPQYPFVPIQAQDCEQGLDLYFDHCELQLQFHKLIQLGPLLRILNLKH